MKLRSMDDDTFEQWLSQWLDEPDNPALRAQIEAAIAGRPALRREYELWTRLDRALRDEPHAARVSWEKLHARITARIAAPPQDAAMFDAALDGLLAADAVAGRVAWDRLRARISGRLPASRPARRTWGRALAPLALATAAGLALLWWRGLTPEPPVRLPEAHGSFAAASVVPQAAPGSRAGGGGYARVVVSADGASPARDDVEPELFLIIDAAPRASGDGRAGPAAS